MQTYSKLFIVLPCHSLEDFPIHYRGSDAADLLANWTALWHPALIASCGRTPDWIQADNPDIGLDFEELAGNERPEGQHEQTEQGTFLVLIPSVAKTAMDDQVRETLNKQQAVILSDLNSRSQIVQQALDANQQAKSLLDNLDGDLAQDFLALGYAFLQVQIMTRQLRYSSNLDEAGFSAVVVDAAKKATAGKTEEASESLMRCFDLLLDEKNGYYPVEPDLIDVVLTAPTTLGSSFDRQLEAAHPVNVLLTGVQCELLAAKRPGLAQKLQALVKDEKVTVIGGLADELPDSLIASESTLNQFLHGRASVKEILQVEPQVFMRRRFGLTSATPGLLDQLKFTGAVHATLDDGKFPNSANCNIRWTGDDDRSIMAIGDLPLSAADAGSFLGLGVRLGEAIDSAHIATIVLVHWPGATCESFSDLVRISEYGPLFGKFVGLNEYFDSVYDPGYGDTFSADEYRPPFLKQAVEGKSLQPISRFTKYWRRFYFLGACRSALVQACAKTGLGREPAALFQRRIEELQSETEAALNVELPDDQGIEAQLESLQGDLKKALRPPVSSLNEPSNIINVINTTSFKRVVEFTAKSVKTGTLKNQSPVLICDCTDVQSNWVVELPPMGSTIVDLTSPGARDELKSDPLVGEPPILRNELFEVRIDEITGGIRSIQLYGGRTNLASQQLAVRLPDGQGSSANRRSPARYTRMVADRVSLVMDSRIAGTINTQGRLLDGDNVAAEFEQTVRVVRGQRVIEVNVELDPRQSLSSSVNHYICSRLAWKSEASRIIVNAGETRQEINSDWFHATNFLEINQEDDRLTMLTGGIPFHRRASRRMVDTILVVGEERQRRFKFGLGVNIPYPMASAVAWSTPQWTLEPAADQGENNSSRWLFHFDRKNILVTWWQPIFDEDPSLDQSQWRGVQMRLRETEGRGGSLSISCPCPISSGDQVNFVGDPVKSLEIAQDEPTKLKIEFGRFDYFQISIRWKI